MYPTMVLLRLKLNSPTKIHLEILCDKAFLEVKELFLIF